jgi:urease accessory protein
VESTVDVGVSATLDVTTQACERIYRALGNIAEVTTRLQLRNGATLHWLPQETILFDGGRLHRTLDVDMAGDASLLVVEPTIFGRVASGETLGDGLFHDSWRVWRAGRLVFADETRLDGPLDDILSRPAVLAGAKATATVLLAAPDAPSFLAHAREIFANHTAGASTFDGMLLCRIAAPDSMALRKVLIPLLTLLRGGTDLPRVWHL